MTNQSMEKNSTQGLLPWVGFSLIIVILDFLSKSYFETQYYLGESRPITSFFNLVLAHNTGAAFSFLAAHDGWQRYFFILIAIVAVAFCLLYMKRHLEERLLCLSLSMIMGGALGNVIDRIIYGYVVDFLDFHYMYWHWPAFNFADIAIVLGAGLMILESFTARRS